MITVLTPRGSPVSCRRGIHPSPAARSSTWPPRDTRPSRSARTWTSAIKRSTPAVTRTNRHRPAGWCDQQRERRAGRGSQADLPFRGRAGHPSPGSGAARRGHKRRFQAIAAMASDNAMASDKLPVQLACRVLGCPTFRKQRMGNPGLVLPRRELWSERQRLGVDHSEGSRRGGRSVVGLSAGAGRAMPAGSRAAR